MHGDFPAASLRGRSPCEGCAECHDVEEKEAHVQGKQGCSANDTVLRQR